MKKFVFMNDRCNENNLADGSIVLKYNTSNKVLSIVDNVNHEIIDNLTNESLNEYAKKAEIPTKISQLKNDSNFVKKTDIPAIPDLSLYVTNDELTTNFYNRDQIDSKISEIVSCTWKIIGVFNSKEELKQYSNPKVGYIGLVGDKEYLYVGENIDGIEDPWVELGINIDLNVYATKDELNDYATINRLSGYATKDELNNYATVNELSSGYATKDELNNYATINGLSGYATKDELNNSGFITINDIPEVEVPTGLAQLDEKSYNSLTDKPTFGEVDILQIKLAYLEEQLNKLVKTSSTVVVNSTDLSQPDNDLFIEIEEPIQGQVTNINGKSITVKQLDVANGRLNVVATDDVNFSNLTTEGNLPKSTSNAQVSINTSDYVKITDSDINQISYNAIEIGLTNTSAPKSIIIDNINFEGTLSNNAILIFNTAENATINISNCTFKEVSNAVRLSNRDNVSGIVLNLINCEFGKWDSNPEYAGVVICEDYSSKSTAAEASANLFAPNKVTINFINCTHNGNKITFNSPEEIAGTKNVNTQLVYVYYDYTGHIAYNADRYPTITCK